MKGGFDYDLDYEREWSNWVIFMRVLQKMIHDPCQESLAATGKILYSIEMSVGIFIYVESSDCELVGFKNADMANTFQMRSAFVSWCINRQPIFSVVHRREVSGVKSPTCWNLLVGKIALRLRNWNNDFCQEYAVSTSVFYGAPCTKTCINTKQY